MKAKSPSHPRLFLAAIVLGSMIGLSVYWGWPLWQKQQSQSKLRQDIHNQVHTILEQHHPDGQWLLQAINQLPLSVKLDDDTTIKWRKNDPVERYLPSPELKDILLRLGTLIHESSHQYHFRAGLLEAAHQRLQVRDTDAFLKLWLRPQEQFFLVSRASFPAREIVKQIPQSAQTDRFKEYIDNADDDLATQKDGLFGLLDEWLAYYQGIRVELALLNQSYSHVDQIPEAQRQIWLDYASMMSDDYLAYSEFKLYILAYLYKAQSDYPKLYQSLVQDRPLKVVLAKINREYQELIPKYLTLRRHFVVGSSLEAKRYLEELNVTEQHLKAVMNKPIYQQLEKEFMP